VEKEIKSGTDFISVFDFELTARTNQKPVSATFAKISWLRRPGAEQAEGKPNKRLSAYCFYP
jgi:hypothetical protein